MKRKLAMILAICVLVAQLCACADVTEKRNVVSISIEQKSSFGVGGGMNVRATTLSSDGRFSTGFSSGQLKGSAFKKLGNMACRKDFLEVPDVIDTGVLDGHFTYIKIEFDDATILVKGGLVAEEFGPKAFRDLYKSINKAVQVGKLDPQNTTAAEK